MKAIIITGTPGTGKSALARELSLLLGYEYLDVSQLIKKEGLSEGYDLKRRCSIVDPTRLNKTLIKLINNSKKPLIIDSHISHFLPKKYVKFCIVTKCNLKVLKKRLEKKGYSQSKIRENLDAEIFDVCLTEAKEKGHKLLVVDTTKSEKILGAQKHSVFDTTKGGVKRLAKAIVKAKVL